MVRVTILSVRRNKTTYDNHLRLVRAVDDEGGYREGPPVKDTSIKDWLMSVDDDDDDDDDDDEGIPI